MNDQLKKFIDDNRESFDSIEPRPQVLRQLKEQLADKKSVKKNSRALLGWAAVITGIIVLSVTVYFMAAKKKNDTGIVKKELHIQYDESVVIGDPVYAKQIVQFKEVIGLQQDELKQLQKDYPDLYRQFVNDITELDSSYQSLKLKLAVNPNKEILLEAMIQNLQLQSELLNRQLLIIKEVKQKSINHEKTSI